MDSYENKLERIKKTLSCFEPDRIPIFELFWDYFVKNWQKEKVLSTETVTDAGNIPYARADTLAVSQNIDQKEIKNDNFEEEISHENPYTQIPAGVILYHPSTEIKQFDDSMIFVNVEKVLDSTKQRSFTMFFTPNKEYARRYSGMWSLNKRNIYVHKLVTKTAIPGIRILNTKLVPDNLENLSLAQGFCGDSIDGYINGIKIEQPVGNNQNVTEYYICNPSQFFKHISTDMQFSSTEWSEINLDTIKVPNNDDEF